MKHIFTTIALFFTTTTFAQNVGIGTTTPDEKLQVDSVIRIGKNAIITSGSTRKNTIKFGDGNFATIGEQDKDDRIVLNAGSFSFRTGNVGIGLDSATEKLHVNGDIRADTIISKALRITTNAGHGKVLTSDGVGNATWANAAYGNIERFQFRLSGFFGALPTSPIALTTFYNFGTATTTYTAEQDELKININKSGLYHFDINTYQVIPYDHSITSVYPTPQLIYFGIVGGPLLKGFSAYYKNDVISNSSYDKAYEVFITAPAVFRIKCELTIPAGEYRMVITGHMISE
jgi:hypothetical protein